MKADDYVKRFLEYKQNPPKVWDSIPDGVESDPLLDAILGICLDLIRESKEIASARHAKSGSATEAILREQNQKFLAFARRLPDEPIPPGMFKLVLMERWPQLTPFLKKWPGEINTDNA